MLHVKILFKKISRLFRESVFLFRGYIEERINVSNSNVIQHNQKKKTTLMIKIKHIPDFSACKINSFHINHSTFIFLCNSSLLKTYTPSEKQFYFRLLLEWTSNSQHLHL